MPAVLVAQKPTPPPPTNVVLPRPDFRFKGNVGRTVSEDEAYQAPFPCTGTINTVTIKLRPPAK